MKGAPRHAAAGRLASILPAVLAALALLGVACAAEEDPPEGITANRVIAHAPVNSQGAGAGDWPWFFDSSLALGSPGGTFDVVSLGYDPAATGTRGGSLTLGLGTAGNAAARHCAVNGTGDDLVVYENAFPYTDPTSRLAGTNSETAILAVAQSLAGPWYEFPYSLDDTLHVVQPARYSGLAGITPTADGGDRFDLATLIAAHGLAADFRACYVRLTDGGTALPDYGNTQTDLWKTGADIDAVAVLHAEEADGLSD